MTVSKIKDIFGNKTVRLVLICLLALVLLLVSYRVFAVGESKKTGSGYVPTAQEARLVELLKQIDGIENATVMITEENGETAGVIVIFNGNDGLLIRMRILEITSAALHIAKSDILIYPSA